jgi:hypothetical protein
MIRTLAALLLCAVATAAQTPATVKIALSAHSTVPKAEIAKALDDKCSGAVIVADAAQADYILESTDSGTSSAHRYKLALSDHKRQVFQVDGASDVGHAMVNICGFLHIRKGF